jgi:hypothetical protein
MGQRQGAARTPEGPGHVAPGHVARDHGGIRRRFSTAHHSAYLKTALLGERYE